MKAGALLTRATAAKKNNDRFVVERSANSTTFSAVSTVRGQGNMARATEHHSTDAGVVRWRRAPSITTCILCLSKGIIAL